MASLLFRNGVSVFLATVVLVVAASNAFVQAQQQQPGEDKKQTKPEPLKGTVSEVIRKGKATTLVIESAGGGEPIKVPVTPQIQFSVESKGDIGFLREKQTVSGTGVMTNDTLFVRNWTVHVGLQARKLRPAFQKSEVMIGASVNSYNLLGVIQSRQQDKDYPEYETVLLNVPQLKGKPVFIEKNPTVTVSMSESDRITEGAKCEFFQVIGPGNRVKILALKVILADELKSEDFFAEDDNRKKK